MTKQFYTFTILIVLMTAYTTEIKAQCTWQNTITDGFEYQTVCPDLIPGTTIHNVPQSFAVYNGSYSLYLNFVNCVGTTGCCAGDTVYRRSITVCRNMPVRFSAWFTTSFSGLQCDIKIVITDGNNNVLNLQPNIVAPYAPLWTQYNSGTVTPSTDVVNFIMITNVGGGNGNDLSMDDFIMETCTPNSTTTTTTGNICSNNSQFNLIDFLSPNADTTGSWSGPAPLGGGYLGTYTTAVSPTGTYVYSSNFYGQGTGCPATTDSVVVDTIPAPSPFLGNDTIICSTASLLLNPGSFPGASFLWNTGAITSTLLASTIFINGDTNVYYVRVTDVNGCSNSDTITVVFLNCSGVDQNYDAQNVSISPVPANGYLQIESGVHTISEIKIYDNFGKLVKSISYSQGRKIFVGDMKSGIYSIQLRYVNGIITKRFIKI